VGAQAGVVRVIPQRVQSAIAECAAMPVMVDIGSGHAVTETQCPPGGSCELSSISLYR
jgi:hypothetical protein